MIGVREENEPSMQRCTIKLIHCTASADVAYRSPRLLYADVGNLVRAMLMELRCINTLRETTGCQ